MFYLFIFNSIPFILFGLLFVSPSSYNSRSSDQGHIAGSSPPSPLRFIALHLYREKISALPSLADSRRIDATNVLGILYFTTSILYCKYRQKQTAVIFGINCSSAEKAGFFWGGVQNVLQQ